MEEQTKARRKTSKKLWRYMRALDLTPAMLHTATGKDLDAIRNMQYSVPQGTTLQAVATCIRSTQREINLKSSLRRKLEAATRIVG